MQPFRIHVEAATLDDLRRRLEPTRWTRAPGEGWKAGTDRNYLRELVEHWRSGYDWRAQEADLNALPQFTARAGGADVHFVYVKGKHRVPLLLLHGWPDSFIRYT